MRDFDAIALPTGYYLDLVGDPCVVSLCRSDGTVAARFTHITNPEEIRRAAQEITQAKKLRAALIH